MDETQRFVVTATPVLAILMSAAIATWFYRDTKRNEGFDNLKDAISFTCITFWGSMVLTLPIAGVMVLTSL